MQNFNRNFWHHYMGKSFVLKIMEKLYINQKLFSESFHVSKQNYKKFSNIKKKTKIINRISFFLNDESTFNSCCPNPGHYILKINTFLYL